MPWTGPAIKGASDQTKCGCLVQLRGRETIDYILKLFIAENPRSTDVKLYQKLLIVLIKYIKRKKKTQNPFLAKILATMFANN